MSDEEREQVGTDPVQVKLRLPADVVDRMDTLSTGSGSPRSAVAQIALRLGMDILSQRTDEALRGTTAEWDQVTGTMKLRLVVPIGQRKLLDAEAERLGVPLGTVVAQAMQRGLGINTGTISPWLDRARQEREITTAEAEEAQVHRDERQAVDDAAAPQEINWEQAKAELDNDPEKVAQARADLERDLQQGQDDAAYYTGKDDTEVEVAENVTIRHYHRPRSEKRDDAESTWFDKGVEYGTFGCAECGETLTRRVKG